MFRFTYARGAWRALKKIKYGDSWKAWHELTLMLRYNPLETPPAYCEIKDGEFKGCYEREFGNQHRVIYKVTYEEITVGGIDHIGTVMFMLIE